MKNTLEKIYEEAFKLFMTKHYELVTIRDLEQAIGMTRGAIFYYAKDKEDLFRKVIDKYFLESQTLHSKIDYSKVESDMTLKEFISEYVKGVDSVAKRVYKTAMGNLRKKSQMSNIDRSYLSLVLNIGYYYPDFNKRMNEIFGLEIKEWETVIRNAVSTGEIRTDVDPKIVAKQFHFIFHGLAFNSALEDGIRSTDLEALYLSLYDFIKS